MYYPKTSLSNNIKIQNWGTFDVSNYGDLIFPLILDFEIKKRISEIDITLYSPQGGQFEPEPHRWVKRIIRIEEEGFFNEILNYQGIVLGGAILFDLMILLWYQFMEFLNNKQRKNDHTVFL